MGLFDWRRLTPEHWFVDLTDPMDHPLYAVLALTQSLVFALAVFASLVAEPLLAGRPAARRAISRAATIAGFLAAIGLVILMFRWLLVPYFTKRIWLYLWWVGVAAAVAWGAYGARRRATRDTLAA